MRIGDVLALRVEQIGDSSITYTAQKTGKVGRASCPSELCELLKASASPSGFVFVGGKGSDRPLTRQAAWRRLKRAAHRAGLDPDGISPHSLRKSFAVKLYHTEGLKAAQEALQHSSVGTTEIYTFSDWISGENADEPLRRKDLPILIERVTAAIIAAKMSY
jgi:integrase